MRSIAARSPSAAARARLSSSAWVSGGSSATAPLPSPSAATAPGSPRSPGAPPRRACARARELRLRDEVARHLARAPLRERVLERRDRLGRLPHLELRLAEAGVERREP